ncbi:dipeptide transport system substrate-binding protein [Melghirimyces profundicolus]|uniref:Dipeptide transport system substrate-binding protein n=1 Tax=Melghirimyces profundicolus TaxID=1242148 RepID=A0A2T6C9D4_9BACL|nr:peptide ABC transporter substrate-binding protein [Melghirimyces profundicolus]PTX64938.1 dipeptide transport system substrate-binding protein [Melghirimyces profundicolus]
MKRSWMGLLAVLLAVNVFLAGCGGEEQPDADTAKSPTLKLNLSNGEPTSIDPALAFDSDSMEVVNNLFEGLTRLDKNHQAQPAVAEKIDKSEDGLTYTFTLRDEAKWSNGEPVTAHDFEYAWKRVMDPKTASSASFLMFFIKNAEKYNAGKASADEVGVKAKDDHTLVVELEQPTPFFEQLTAYTPFAPVYKKGVEGQENPFGDDKNYVSNGPFKMKSWKHDEKIVAVKNEHYQDADKVKLPGVQWSMIADATTAYQMYKQGNLHLGVAPPDLQGKVIESGEAKVMDGSGLEFYRFNTEKEPFTNKKIRKALALAVDRKTIVDHVIQGKQKPAYAYVAPGTQTEAGDFRENGETYIEDAQLDEAKKLLEEGMKEEGWDNLPEISILYNKDDTHKKVAETIQDMWRKHLGVKVKLQAREVKTYFDDQKSGNYIVSRSSFLPDYNDPYNYLESFQTDHPMNRTGWSDKEYDKLLSQARNETDEDKRMEVLHKAEERLFEEMPLFPIYYYNTIVLQQPEVKNVLRHTVGPNDYRFTEIQG